MQTATSINEKPHSRCTQLQNICSRQTTTESILL